MILVTIVNVKPDAAIVPHVHIVAMSTAMSGSSVPSSVLKLKNSVINTTTTTSGMRFFKSLSMNFLELSVRTGSP